MLLGLSLNSPPYGSALLGGMPKEANVRRMTGYGMSAQRCTADDARAHDQYPVMTQGGHWSNQCRATYGSSAVLSIGVMSPFCTSRKGRTPHLTAAYDSIVDYDKPRTTYFVSDASVIQQPAHLILGVASLRALHLCLILSFRDPLSFFSFLVCCIWRRRMFVPAAAYF